jgi:GTP cyclohydrolase I
MNTDLTRLAASGRNGADDAGGRLRPFDGTAVEQAVAALIRALGENPEREGLRDTPRRIAQMYAEILSGLDVDPAEFLSVQFGNGYDEMVILRDIPFYSMCEHHFLPFHGVAHVGYIPEGRVVGISKIARVVEAFAKRLQLQERLTSQVADCVMQAIKPDGVAVVVEAEHLCMTMRGVRKPGSRMVTSAMRGGFRKQSVTRAEFLSLVQGG